MTSSWSSQQYAPGYQAPIDRDASNAIWDAALTEHQELRDTNANHMELFMTEVQPAPTQPTTAVAVMKRYSSDFAAVMPSHISAPTWLRVAQASLKTGKRDNDGRFILEVAAMNNQGVFLSALLNAARLGLEPGTEQFYLTPRKVKGRLEILGIVGYQGLVELMYRSGAVSSVIAEIVYTGDKFSYQPGRDEKPNHEIDWDASDRGALRLAYAYAIMADGATSKVVVMNKIDIAKVKTSSQGSDSEYSPWRTHPEAMWRKSTIRQLAKWVPTSSEFRKTQLRDVQQVNAERDSHSVTFDLPEPVDSVDPITGEVLDGELIDTDAADQS